MERDASVKRLDFEDVSLTVPPGTVVAAMALSGGTGNALEDSAASTLSGSVVDSDRSIAELRQEAKRIRENLTSVDAFVTSFSEPFQQKVKEEAKAHHPNMSQLKKMFSILEAESNELKVNESVLQRFAEWQIGDEINFLADESATETQKMEEELTELRDANAETIREIESLIKTIAGDVRGLEMDLSTASSCLDTFDLEADNLADEEGTVDKNLHERSLVQHKQSDHLQDLEITIRHLEETLRQNEKDYFEAEAAMESRIEQYNLEIEELQAQANQLDKEEECMRTLVDVTTRYLQPQKHMESSNDVSIVSHKDGYVELQLTTRVPTMDDLEGAMEQGSNSQWEHNLHVKFNQGTMEIEEAKLIPGDVQVDDLLSSVAQKKNITSASITKNAEEGNLEDFGPQLRFLVRSVHQRLIVHVVKVATLSKVSSDPRYCVDQISGSSVITVTKPEKLKFSVEVPQDWPKHESLFRLQSLDSLEGDPNDAATRIAMTRALEVANQLPNYVRCDLLTFIQEVEKIVNA